ncbi:MAG: homocysteine S-methyltransferase family protein [Clostridia bacterium]|nr:homocysteine S-methyltransferase family protein [Clostridia bacterium]
MKVTDLLKKKRLYFDGGYGTLFQEKGLKPGEKCEKWNVEKSEIVKNIHLDYLRAGADILKTNTFGANILKFDKTELEEIIAKGVENAREAIAESGFKDKFVALDIGPTGKLLKPLGDMEFEKAVEAFAQTVKLGVKNGVDLILIETMNDCLETKAAVLAAKENSSLPVFVTNAYDESGKLMTGASPLAMVAMLEGLRVDAIGVNCSLGPDKMKPIIEQYVKYSSLPVIVNPNAGLPVFENGKTTFAVDADEFSCLMKEIALMGASILGGCCGTTPAHIKETVSLTQDIPYTYPGNKNITVISSYTKGVIFDKEPILIGERINPTGKPLFKQALRENNIEYILNEGLKQAEKGVAVLDVNVGLPEINEAEMLVKVTEELQAVCDLPLQLDTTNIDAMEKALRCYNGKALINSVNGKKESMEKIFPLAAKYGGVIIALTLDETGIPQTAEGRIQIAEKIISEASNYGIDKKDIIVDPLAMTVSSDPKSALVTLECIKMLTKMGIKTSLGVSNVSFGLPARNLINSSFFTMALLSGLSAAIMNPFAEDMLSSYYSFLALCNLDTSFEKYIAFAAVQTDTKPVQAVSDMDCGDRLMYSIKKGLKEDASSCARKALEKEAPLDVINKYVIPALDFVGKGFEEKKLFLPQLLMSAEAAKSAFDVIKESLALKGGSREKKYTVIIATVKGDIHDIGKNIVKVLLENYDYNVIDLGKDVEPSAIVSAAIKEKARLVALSALMTTTVPAMEETIRLLKEKYPECKTMVGGAVLTKTYADAMGADFYGKDAMTAVRYAETL